MRVLIPLGMLVWILLGVGCQSTEKPFVDGMPTDLTTWPNGVPPWEKLQRTPGPKSQGVGTVKAASQPR